MMVIAVTIRGMSESFWKRLLVFMMENRVEFETLWNSKRICVKTTEFFDTLTQLKMPYSSQDVAQV